MREDASQQSVGEVIAGRETSEIFAQWNATAIEYPAEKCIQDHFQEQVRRWPEQTALIFRKERLTYQELDARAESIARILNQLGAGPEVIVAACIPRSPELIVALLAILKTGAAYLPLDPEFPDERLQLMLGDSEAPILITKKSLARRFSYISAQKLFLDENAPVLTSEPPRSAETRPQGSNLAYIIYTSGSSGVPKGVMIEHRNVSNFFVAMDKFLGDRPGVWLAATSISFDISILELFWTLSRGFTVILHGDEERLALNGETSISHLFEQHQVTHFQCTPSLIRWLSASEDFKRSLRPLIKLIIGGEPFPSSLAAMLTAAVSGEVLNAYGPTETTIWSAMYRLGDNEQSVPIGKPVANTEMYVLDEDLQRVPIGATGELFIGGAGVARGYLNRTELTAQKFLKNPFDPRTGTRIYRTGDLVRYRPNGDLEYRGRADNQVKIRGFRIELEEIESQLQRHPQVGDCAVIAKTEESGERSLVAYVAGVSEAVLRPHELRVFLEEKVPSHMVPSSFLYVEMLPLTPNGKIDRRALESMRSIPVTVRRDLQNTSHLEEVVVSIWCQALNSQTVDRKTNFIDLGANSMSFVEVVTQLKERLQVRVALPELFEHPTIELLVRHLRKTMENRPGTAAGTQRGQFRREALQRRGNSRLT